MSEELEELEKPEEVETDEVEAEEEVVEEQPEVEESDDDKPEEEPDELVVSLDENADEDAGAPEWVKEVRRTNRDQAKRIKELEAQLSTPANDELGTEPQLADFDYDEAAFKTAWAEWNGKKVKADAEQAKQQELAEQQAQAWQAKVDRYEEGKGKLGVKDYDLAEATVQDALSKGPSFPGMVDDIKFKVIQNTAPDPNLMVYALSRNPKKLEELSQIEDLSEFAFRLGELNKGMQVSRKAPPPPEGGPSSRGSSAGVTDTALDKAYKQGQKTGDFTKYHEMKRRKKKVMA